MALILEILIMPRKRADQTLAWLPPRVYVHRDNYVYQPKSGGKVVLCPVSAGKLAVLKRHEQEKGRVDNGVFFEHIITEFYASDTFKELAIRTRKDYLAYGAVLSHVFGKMRPNVISQHHVFSFMEWRAKTAGMEQAKRSGNAYEPANQTANKNKACLQSMCSWALQRGKLKQNPCVGVKKLKTKARDRYINDFEYQAIYNCAPPACRVAMEISYLCMARIGDVMQLTMRDVLDDGLFIEQGKTGKKQIKLWSKRLTAAIESARNLPRRQGMTTIFLISKQDGSPYSTRSIQSQYSKACVEAKVTGATLHDLKAKGVSDFEGTLADKQNAAGHTTPGQTATYDRKIKTVRAVK